MTKRILWQLIKVQAKAMNFNAEPSFERFKSPYGGFISFEACNFAQD
jgi:hypothetical protein